MAGGSFISNTGTNLEIGADWTAVSNAEGNYSSVKVDVFLTHYSIYCASLSGSYIKIGDSVYNFSKGMSVSQNSYAKTYIASYETKVPHLNDGTKNVVISVGWNFSGVYNGTSIGMLEASKNVELDPIPRVSTFSIPANIELGSEITATVTSYLSSHRHRLCFALGDYEEYTSFTSDTEIRATVAPSLAERMTDSASRIGKVTLHTYDSKGKWIGERSVQVTYIVPHTSEFLPEFNLALSPDSPSAFLNQKGIYASGVSRVRAAVTDSVSKYGAAVVSCEISVGSTKNKAYSVLSDVLSAGDVAVTAKVTDSRGLSSIKKSVISVKLYHMPYASAVSVFRCDENGEGSDSGSYIRVHAIGKFSSLDGANGCDLRLSYKAHSSEEYTESISVASATPTVIPAGLSAENSYDVKITCSDTVGFATDHTVRIPTAKVDMHIKNGSIRFGGFCEKQGFDCNWDANFAGKVSIGEVPISDFVVGTGKNGIFKWRKWSSGISECFGNTGVKTHTVSEKWGALYRSAEAQRGFNYPYGLFIEAPLVQASLCQENLSGMTLAALNVNGESNTPDFYVVSPVSVSVDVSIDLYCVGRWK